MQIQLGNPRPQQCVTVGGTHTHEPVDGPAITYLVIPDGDQPDGSPLYGLPALAEAVAGDDAMAEQGRLIDQVRTIALHLAQNPDVTRLPGHEALLAVVHPTGGLWQHHGAARPSWVWSDSRVMARLLGAYYDCPIIEDGDLPPLEDTYFTLAGPPGVVPGTGRVDMNITQNGRDICAQALGGGQVGAVGQATAATATTLTTGSSFTTNQWAGYRVAATVDATHMVWGNVISNTPGVLTVDRWYTPSTPGGTAGATPAATATFIIMDGAAPAWFMALTANSTSPAAPSTSTALTAEIATSGGGLIRKICPWAHTASAQTYTLTPVFTANLSDVLPVTIAKIGVFNSMVVSDSTQTMLFETLLNVTATLSTSGDQLTITETVTLT